jgi:hypothetical protein
VALGSAGGALAAPTYTTLAGSSHPEGVAAGDFDGNGALDVVTVEKDADTVVILLGDGAGHLAPAAVSTYKSTLPRGVAVADLNHDARPDLVVLSAQTCVAQVFLNAGAAAFTVAGQYGLGTCNSNTLRLSLADADGDGELDVLVGHDTTMTLAVLRGDGTGAFPGPLRLYVVPADHGAPRVAVLDEDGRPDRVTVGYWFQNAVFVARGR